MYLILKELGLNLFCYFPQGTEHVVPVTSGEIFLVPRVQGQHEQYRQVLSKTKSCYVYQGIGKAHTCTLRDAHTEKKAQERLRVKTQ